MPPLPAPSETATSSSPLGMLLPLSLFACSTSRAKDDVITHTTLSVVIIQTVRAAHAQGITFRRMHGATVVACAQSATALQCDCFECKSKDLELALGLKVAFRPNLLELSVMMASDPRVPITDHGNGIAAVDCGSTIATEHDLLLLPCSNVGLEILHHGWT
jgi:hypothetical protein